MVKQCMEYIDETPDLETRIELIKTLNTVSAGKVGFLFCQLRFIFYMFGIVIVRMYLRFHLFFLPSTDQINLWLL